jgi:hypothetical protein
VNSRDTQPAPAIFGLRYLEDEAADINDVVGCATNLNGLYTTTSCDDQDIIT